MDVSWSRIIAFEASYRKIKEPVHVKVNMNCLKDILRDQFSIQLGYQLHNEALEELVNKTIKYYFEDAPGASLVNDRFNIYLDESVDMYEIIEEEK